MMSQVNEENIQARQRYEAQQKGIQENLARIAALNVGDRVRVVSLGIGDRWERETVIEKKTNAGGFRVEMNPDWLFRVPKHGCDYRCRQAGGRKYGDRIYVLSLIEERIER